MLVISGNRSKILGYFVNLKIYVCSRLASYLQREYDYLPLSTALKALGKINNMLKRTPEYGAFQKYMRKLIGGTYMKSGGLAAMKILNGNDLMSVKTQVITLYLIALQAMLTE